LQVGRGVIAEAGSAPRADDRRSNR
jgi:hypothetical protein